MIEHFKSYLTTLESDAPNSGYECKECHNSGCLSMYEPCFVHTCRFPNLVVGTITRDSVHKVSMYAECANEIHYTLLIRFIAYEQLGGQSTHLFTHRHS